MKEGNNSNETIKINENKTLTFDVEFSGVGVGDTNFVLSHTLIFSFVSLLAL